MGGILIDKYQYPCRYVSGGLPPCKVSINKIEMKNLCPLASVMLGGIVSFASLYKSNQSYHFRSLELIHGSYNQTLTLSPCVYWGIQRCGGLVAYDLLVVVTSGLTSVILQLGCLYYQFPLPISESQSFLGTIGICPAWALSSHPYLDDNHRS